MIPGCRKIPYSSRKEARLTAKATERRGGKGKQEAYQCKHCGFWHLTSTSRREFKKKVAGFGAGRAGAVASHEDQLDL